MKESRTTLIMIELLRSASTSKSGPRGRHGLSEYRSDSGNFSSSAGRGMPITAVGACRSASASIAAVLARFFGARTGHRAVLNFTAA